MSGPTPTGATLIGYAGCLTRRQDLAAQRAALEGLGVAAERTYVDHGVSGTTRAGPALDQALAAARSGDTLVVPKLDCLARSVPDARAIADQLASRGVRLQLGTSFHDRTDPMGRIVLQHPGHLRRVRGRPDPPAHSGRHGPGPRQGSLKGTQPKLNVRQQKELARMPATRE